MKFLKSIKSKFIVWILSGKTYAWALKYIIPYVRFSMYYSKFPGVKYHIAYALMEPGDILLTTDPKKLTTILIGGDWAHAAVSVSKDKNFEIAEMTHKDYTKSTLFDVCKESERIRILRFPFSSNAHRDAFIRFIKSLDYTKYDPGFSFGVEMLYCSELPYQADMMCRQEGFPPLLDVNLEDLVGIGRLYLSPTGLANGKNAVVIYDSGPLKSKSTLNQKLS